MLPNIGLLDSPERNSAFCLKSSNSQVAIRSCRRMKECPVHSLQEAGSSGASPGSPEGPTASYRHIFAAISSPRESCPETNHLVNSWNLSICD
jgi:hypothetical protein